MRITKLILHRFERLHMLKEETLELDLTKDTLIIQGTNGAGKSSCLAELSPLPAIMRQYKEGGHKTIHLIHNQHQYILHSSGSGAGKHSFLMDGEELNTGGTLTVQYQLVDQHFNYTPRIHQLLLGKTTFTTMSSNERRDWFNQMSKIDNDFIDRLWDAIKSGQRDVQGALKNTQQKITENTQAIATDEEMQAYRAEQQELIGYQTRLLELRGKYQVSSTTKLQDINTISDIITKYTTAAQIYIQRLSVFLGQDIAGLQPQDIQERLNALKLTEQGLRQQQIKALEQLDQFKSTLHQYEFTSQFDEQQLEVLKQRYRQKLIEYQQLSNYEEIQTKYQRLTEQYALTAIPGMLKETLSLPANRHVELFDDIQLWRQEPITHPSTVSQQHRLVQERLAQLQRGLFALKERHASNAEHLEQLTQSPEHICPSCQYRFRGKSIEERIAQLTAQNQQIESKLKQGEEGLQQRQQQDQHYTEILQCYHRIRSHLFEEKRLQYLLVLQYDLSDLEEIFSQSLAQFDHAYTQSQQLASRLLEYHQLQTDWKVIEDLEQKKRLSASPEAIQLRGQILTLESNLEQLNQQLDQIKPTYDHLQAGLRQWQQLEKQQAALDQYSALITDQYNEHTLQDAIQTINSMLEVINEQLSEVNKKLQHQAGLEYVLDHLNKDKVALEDDLDAHKQLMKLLSPKDGLIAKTTVGFVRHFVKEMNHLIGHVWSHPLELVPDEEGLFTKDYKFPVKIGNTQSKFSPDVSETSTGQTEIINLAFKLTAMKYLNLLHYPLYADEVGGSLIPQFRYNLYTLFGRFLEEQRVSALYVISHLQDIHAILSSPQVVDLNQ